MEARIYKVNGENVYCDKAERECEPGNGVFFEYLPRSVDMLDVIVNGVGNELREKPEPVTA